ncbi:MAG: M23 family metallopeptidase [Devosia sp.]|nr:M23 family metallopeptidase [Devosia sp.]
MSAAQRNRQFAQLRASGFEDCPALTLQSTDGDIPHGRELSIAWLTGTVMTGLTSVLLMGAALYVSFEGQATFSTAYEALQILTSGSSAAPSNVTVKTARARPIQQTKSEVEMVGAAIKENVDGKDMIRNQNFERIKATLATVATSLSDDVPAYDPVAVLAAADPIASGKGTPAVSTDIYGANVEGDVAVHLTALPATLVPARVITDQAAADFVKTTVEGAYSEQDTSLQAYAPTPADNGLHDLGVVKDTLKEGVAENVTVMPKNRAADDATLGRAERILTLHESAPLEATLLKNGFTQDMIDAIITTLHNVYPSTDLPVGARLRILFGPSRNSDTLIPYRMSIYIEDKHAATVALTDKGQYVLALAPPDIKFPEEDTEDVNVASLPTIYRAIWETARKHDVPDDITRRIVGMYAYDIDETKKITAGDSIEMLETPPVAGGKQELLYVSLGLGGTKHELFRFHEDDGTVDFFDPNGESGKRFLNRRPLQGGGLGISSPFGWRIHPIFHTRRLHTGVDLAAAEGTPIYAAGDGVVERAGWSSGYGRFVMIKHVNGFETAYGHMSRIADITQPGATVRQGQIIGYVGHTGFATGPHLHFEVRINGNFVDPLSVKLPRDKTLPAQDEQQFAQTVAQIQDLMKRDGTPVVATAPAAGAPAPAPTAENTAAPVPLAPRVASN